MGVSVASWAQGRESREHLAACPGRDRRSRPRSDTGHGWFRGTRSGIGPRASDKAARQPPARPVQPAPAALASRAGPVAVRARRTGAGPAAAAYHHRPQRGQHPGDRGTGRHRLRHPGPGQHHFLAAFPGGAVGLRESFAPAEPVPRRPDRVANLRAGPWGLRVLGHRGAGHRQRPGGVGDRAGRGSSSRPPHGRPDAGPSGESLYLDPAGTDAGGDRRGRPRHPRRPVPPALHGRAASCRGAAATAPRRHLATRAGHLATGPPAPPARRGRAAPSSCSRPA